MSETEKWPYCEECGGILNFAGKCPNGHCANDPDTAEPVVKER